MGDFSNVACGMLRRQDFVVVVSKNFIFGSGRGSLPHSKAPFAPIVFCVSLNHNLMA